MTIRVSCRYAMLICSLPALPPQPFAARQTPLSRLQLERRLALLEPEHLRDLDLIENVTHWDRMSMETTDKDLLKRAQDALEIIRNPVLKELIRWRLELRTLMAALRIRRRGLAVKVNTENFGHRACIGYIQRNWHRPDFGLGHIHPWLNEAQRLLAKGDHIALERLLFATVWNHHGNAAREHHFDFEAVALYVLRWNLVDRWIRYDNEAARRRFLDLMKQGLGDAMAPSVLSWLPA